MSKGFNYKGNEEIKNKELEALMNEWIAELSKNPEPINNGDKSKITASACFAKDGFFPGYFNQKRKVLFISRETRKIGGYDFRIASRFVRNFVSEKSHKSIMLR